MNLTEKYPQRNVQIWLVWAIVAALVTMVARNPLYTLIVLLSARLVMLSHGKPQQRLPLPLWKLGGAMLLISALFNGLFVHIGETVLFVLPAQIPLIGGNVTLEAILFGANNGLTLWTLLVVFAAFNEIVPAHALIRLIPSAFRDVSLVLLIAVSYVPATLEHWQRVREAQAIRGHELHGWRDWQPVMIPLLVGGLERAMGLAEAMVARGYGATTDDAPALGLRLGYVMGLLALLVGWFLAFWQGGVGWFLMGCALLFLLALLWNVRSRQPLTRYEPVVWQKRDLLFLILCLVPVGFILFPAILSTPGSLFYAPYPRLTMPAFDPIFGIAISLLALPGMVRRER